MTHDPLFVARLLHHPAVRVGGGGVRLHPARRAGPLSGRRRHAPRLPRQPALAGPARPVPADLGRCGGPAAGSCWRCPARRIVVTGAPLDPAFETLPPGRPRHVLVVAGADPRKNPDCAIRAHAQAAALQAARVPLVITGAYGAEWLDAQRNRVAELGGDRALLQAPGHVDEADLLRLYADALVRGGAVARRGVLAAGGGGHGGPGAGARIGHPGASRAAAGGPVRAGRRGDAGRAAGARRWQPAWRAAALGAAGGGLAAVPRGRGGAAVLVGGRPRSRRARAPVEPARPQAAPGLADAACRRIGRGWPTTAPRPVAELGKRVELHVFTPTRSPGRPDGAATVNPLSALPLLSSRFDRVVGGARQLGVPSRDPAPAAAAMAAPPSCMTGACSTCMPAIWAWRRRWRWRRPSSAARCRRTRSGPGWRATRRPAALILVGDRRRGRAVADAFAGRHRARSAGAIGEPAVHLPFCLYRTMAEGERTSAARAGGAGEAWDRPRHGAAGELRLCASVQGAGRLHLGADLLRAWGIAGARCTSSARR